MDLRTSGGDLKPLSPRDFAALQGAVLALHTPRDLVSFRAAAPGVFAGLIRSSQFTLLDWRPVGTPPALKILDMWMEPAPPALNLGFEAIEGYLTDHPFTRYFLRHDGSRQAITMSDFMPLAELRRTRIYREALKPAETVRVMSIGSRKGTTMATLTLCRPESQPDFSARDRRLFEMLRPHFELARANLERETVLRANRTRSLKVAGLTPRETEVAVWLAQGKTNPEIASILAMPVRTVEKHLERILAKLRAANRSAAALAVAEIVRA